MPFLLDLIKNGDFWSLLGLVVVWAYIGNVVANHDAWAHAWGQRLAVFAFVGYCVYGVLDVGQPDATAIFFVAIRAILAGGLTLGVAWNLLGLFAFVRARLDDASQASRSRSRKRSADRAERKRLKEADRQRREEQAEWERTAPQRERRQREEEERRREATRKEREAKHRRQEVLAATEQLFLLYAPEIRDRFGRAEFDAFIEKFMGETETPDVIEARGKQLQKLIRDHHDRVHPPEQFHSLEELARWYSEQKKHIEALPVEKRFMQDYLVQLNERYSDLTQKVLEKLAP